jgi:hypothetical protein
MFLFFGLLLALAFTRSSGLLQEVVGAGSLVAPLVVHRVLRGGLAEGVDARGWEHAEVRW